MSTEKAVGTQKIIAVCGTKNAGKTTLLEKLIPALARRWIRAAVIKHDGHRFAPDREGTDTYRMLAAGAVGAAVFDAEKFQLVRCAPVTERELADFFPEAELILLEGFKGSNGPKIEVLRGGEPVSDPQTRLALVTDDRVRDPGVPVFSPEDIEPLADFLASYVAN